MNSDRIYLVVVPLLRPFVEAMTRERRDQYRAAPLVPGNVVFLGDSITQRGFWDAWFPTLPTLNRGIDGDTTEDILDRLDGAILGPVAVNLLVGTNDLHGRRHLRDLDGIASRTTEIVQRIQQAAPGAIVLVNSVMPRTPHLAGRIRSLNDRYRTIAASTGAIYLDLWPALANPAAGLRKEFTSDNLHLLAPGYRAWTDVLRPHLKGFASRLAGPPSPTAQTGRSTRKGPALDREPPRAFPNRATVRHFPDPSGRGGSFGDRADALRLRP